MQRQFDQADAELKTLLQKFPNDAAILVELGALRTAQGNPVEARSVLAKALTADPRSFDALSAMGISRTRRLVLPKVVALTLVMPLLVLWTSGVALLGGMVSAWMQLDLSFGFFIDTLPRVVPIANLYIALGKGAAFGLLIALVACHFGLRVRPNTESLSANTTSSVVSAITAVILVDAIFAIATRSIGVPG